MSSFPPTTWSALEGPFLEFMKYPRTNVTSANEHEAQADKEGVKRSPEIFPIVYTIPGNRCACRGFLSVRHG